MYKLIRCFAPVVLVLYFCAAIVGPGWGEEKILYKAETPNSEVTSIPVSEKILPDIYTVTKAERKKEFEIKARFFKVIGIDKATSKKTVQPISNIEQVNLILPEGFNLKQRETLGDNVFSYKVIAPKMAGDYQIKFAITSEAWEYSYAMKVVTGFFKNSMAIIGFALCGTIIDNDRSLSINGWGGGGNFFLVIGGAIVGSILGAWIGDKLDEYYYFYNPFEGLIG